MSWSVNAIGLKDKVRESCVTQFDACAKQYEGKIEQADVLGCKAAVLAAIDDDGNGKASEYYNAFKVTASGSCSEGMGYANFSVSVERIKLLL